MSLLEVTAVIFLLVASVHIIIVTLAFMNPSPPSPSEPLYCKLTIIDDGNNDDDDDWFDDDVEFIPIYDPFAGLDDSRYRINEQN